MSMMRAYCDCMEWRGERGGGGGGGGGEGKEEGGKGREREKERESNESTVKTSHKPTEVVQTSTVG